MKWFQYIGQIASLARIFFILAAGFGIQHFLTNFNRQNRNLFLLLAIALFVTFVILLRVCEDSIPLANNALRAFYFAAAILFILAVGLMFRIKMSGKQAAFLLGTFLFLDFTAYHFALASAWTRPQLTTNALTDVVAFDRYQPMRVLEPEFRSHPRRVMVEQDPIERLGIDALNFIQVDPCFEIYTSLLIPENIWRYLEVRANYTRKKNITGYRAEWINSVPLFYEIGCHVPKLRLIENVLIAKEESEVESLLKSNQDLNRIVILDSHGNASEASTPSRTNHLGSIRVNSFSYNQIALEVNVKGSDGAWLYYADTYHADWKATVNQKETFIYPANLAFKAVRLPAGTSQVRMSFNHGKSDFLAKIIAVIGFFFVLAVLSFTFLILPNNA